MTHYHVKVVQYYSSYITTFTVFSCAQVCNVLDYTNDDTSSTHCLARHYDVILDKGTYDAICMNPDDAQNQRRKYQQAVGHLVCRGGLFIITSCNWTQPELIQQFDTGNKVAVVNGMYFIHLNCLFTPSCKVWCVSASLTVCRLLIGT